jgi:hypothetical protein
MKSAGKIVAIALFAVTMVAIGEPQASPAWLGPGSGPVSPYKNYKGFAQVPRQPAGTKARSVQSPPSQIRCVPNVGLVGPDGVCPD